ncbi:MAG: hypothetical protein IKV53_03630 [Clostridia bacterium]|nr:hypothetical protein [Clostridia bacterium]
MKRVLSLILAILMLVSASALLFSCDKEKKENNNETSSSGAVVDDGSIFYERSLVSDDLPEKDYGGRDFRVVIHDLKDIYIPEEEKNKGDLIKDAKLARNEKVENRFNVKIKVVYNGTYGEVSDYVSKTVLAGNDEFDLLMGMAVSTGGLVQKNLFLNWYNIEHVNFDKPWWAESNKTDLTYNGKCPLAVSDLNFSSLTSTYCMLFNKNLAASYELGDIYGIVLDGKWTYDKLHEMVKDIYVDDGNDTRDESDFYGLAHANGSCVNTYLWAFDNPVCAKNAEGVPQIAIKTDKINSIVTDIYDMFYNTEGVYFDGKLSNEKALSGDIFYSKRAIFTTGSIGAPTTERFRNFEDDIGIIPYPKYDENQTEYYTMADGFHTILAVPKTCRDTAFVGMITEALSAESWKTLTPTLYEIALKTRYLRDNESKEIMDIIINGRTFDFGYIYDNWQGYSFTLEFMMRDGMSNFESYYNKQYATARMQYKLIVKAFDKLT